MTWTYVMEEAALPEGGMAPAYPLGVNVVVTRIDGALYAVSGKCAHMACPLFIGTRDGHVLTCGCHDWLCLANSPFVGVMVERRDMRQHAWSAERAPVWLSCARMRGSGEAKGHARVPLLAARCDARMKRGGETV